MPYKVYLEPPFAGTDLEETINRLIAPIYRKVFSSHLPQFLFILTLTEKKSKQEESGSESRLRPSRKGRTDGGFKLEPGGRVMLTVWNMRKN
jgi:hypothetical protein